MQDKKLRVLVACEESQIVCKAFRARGHEAYSCDIQECSGGHPEWHIQGDAIKAVYSRIWDLIIAHPPCTYFSCAGLHYLKTKPERQGQLDNAFAFLLQLWNAPVDRLALENPQGWLNTNWKKPTQVIEPYYFGDPEKKRTCLWLRGLPRLNGNINVALNPSKYHPQPTGFNKRSKDGYIRKMYFCDRMKLESNFDLKTAAKLKSKTFPGIAAAMASQWSADLTQNQPM
jgi:site-specific DNA-cytosine methylase